MRYGLIIAAGNSSRFNSSLPKALSHINTEYDIIQHSITNLKRICDRVAVVCNVADYDKFKDANLRCELVFIHSGKGCGDAVLQVLKKLHKLGDVELVIQWGDCIINDFVYSHVDWALSMDTDYHMIIPCCHYRWDAEKYVALSTNSDSTISNVWFAKYDDELDDDEDHKYAYKDLCIFAVPKAKKLYNFLNYCASLMQDDEGNYVHKHGNEFNFLDIINETKIRTWALIITTYEDLRASNGDSLDGEWLAESFNTVDDLARIKNSNIFERSSYENKSN